MAEGRVVVVERRRLGEEVEEGTVPAGKIPEVQVGRFMALLFSLLIWEVRGAQEAIQVAVGLRVGRGAERSSW